MSVAVAGKCGTIRTKDVCWESGKLVFVCRVKKSKEQGDTMLCPRVNDRINKAISFVPEFAPGGVCVLVVDTENMAREQAVQFLRKSGFRAVGAGDALEAEELARREQIHVAIVDLSMPGISGIETVRRLKTVSSKTEMIILTGEPALEPSLAAIDKHVFAYLCKPPQATALAKAVRRAADYFHLTQKHLELVSELEIEHNNLRDEVEANHRALERRIAASPEFVGQSPAMETIRNAIVRIAPSDLTVLIQGESGTGKDVVARLISDLSGRSESGGFIKINCPAIPEALLESELFGHESGAFTGANKRKPGRFELAPNGTIFLNEIGEIPPNLQAKLLQVIENKQFFRVGGNKMITVNARILTATNAPLEEMMKSGAFRSDLYYRICEYRLCLPPLRQRPEDIPVLVEHFLCKHSVPNAPWRRLSAETMERLVAHHWPGNVRELESVVRRFVVTNDEKALADHFKHGQSAHEGASASLKAAHDDQPLADPLHPRSEAPTTPDTLRQNSIKTILEALRTSEWNQLQAARLLGTSYSTLRRRIKQYGLKPDS